MTKRSHRPVLGTSTLAVAVASALAAGAQGGPVQYHTVALSGQPASGMPAGVNYATFTFPALNESGQVAFGATVAGAGVTTADNTAIYAGSFAAPQLVARSGSPAPSTSAGVSYVLTSVFPPAFNDAGHVAFRPSLTGTGVTAANDTALYAGSAASPQLVGREGSAAPGTAPGVNYSAFTIGGLVLNDSGQVAYGAGLTGTGVTFTNDRAIYAGSIAAPQLVARTGNAAPGTPAGVTYSANLSLRSISDAGQIAFGVDLAGPGVTAANDAALYAGDFSAPQLIVRDGNHAPGTPTGVNYSFSASDVAPTLNDAGQVAYRIALTGTGVTSANDLAIYAGNLAAPQLVMRTGNPAHGMPAGVNYAPTLASGPNLNDAGQVTYLTAVTGPGVTFANDEVLYAGNIAAPQPIAREGNAAPGMPAGVNYGSFNLSQALNDAGQVAYEAFLTGTGVTTANGNALFVYDPLLGNTLIARQGDLFDIGGGDLRTISSASADIAISVGSGDNTATGLSNDGTLVFRLTFTDGSQGVFTALVPEPAGLSLLAAAAVPMAMRRRHRRCDAALRARR